MHVNIATTINRLKVLSVGGASIVLVDATILNVDVSVSHGGCVRCLTCKKFFFRMTVMVSREAFDMEQRRQDNREGACIRDCLISAARLRSLYGSG